MTWILKLVRESLDGFEPLESADRAMISPTGEIYPGNEEGLHHADILAKLEGIDPDQPTETYRDQSSLLLSSKKYSSWLRVTWTWAEEANALGAEDVFGGKQAYVIHVIGRRPNRAQMSALKKISAMTRKQILWQYGSGQISRFKLL